LGYKLAELIWEIDTMDGLQYITRVTDDLIQVKKEQIEVICKLRGK